MLYIFDSIVPIMADEWLRDGILFYWYFEDEILLDKSLLLRFLVIQSPPPNLSFWANGVIVLMHQKLPTTVVYLKCTSSEDHI